MKCMCGSEEFYGHQLCRRTVIVDGKNNFIDEIEDRAVYQAYETYGPYECVKCGAKYSNLCVVDPAYEDDV